MLIKYGDAKMKKQLFISTLIISLFLISTSAFAILPGTDTRVQYNCDGVTTTHAYDFTIYEDDDLEVIVDDGVTSPTTLVLNTDYTVTDAGVSGGGDVELTVATTCASTETLTILRNVELTQDTDYVDGESFSADTLELPPDKLTMIAQQIQEQLDRTPKLAKSSTYAGTEYVFPDPLANSPIGWNSAATDLTTFSATTVTVAQIDYIGNYADLATAVSTIGSNPTTLMINAATVIADGVTVTIPSTLTLWFTDGGRVNGTAGGGAEALAFSGQDPIATATQDIFDTATLTVTGLLRDTPYWFGAAGDGVTDDATEFQAAITASTVTYLPKATYKIDTELTVADYKQIIGEEARTTVLDYTGADGCLTAASVLKNVRYENFTISLGNNANANNYAIYHPTGLRWSVLQDLWIEFTDNTLHGIYLKAVSPSSCWHVDINNLNTWTTDATVATGSAIYIEGDTVSAGRYNNVKINGGSLYYVSTGITIKNSHRSSIINTYFNNTQGTTKEGIVFEGNLNKEHLISHPVFEPAITPQIRIDNIANSDGSAVATLVGTNIIPSLITDSEDATQYRHTLLADEIRASRVRTKITLTSIRSATYKWTLSGSGTGEYYLELAAGGTPGLSSPSITLENSVSIDNGTLGSLAASEYGYGDNDSLGYDTIYIRLSDDSDPDGKAADYVQVVHGTGFSIFSGTSGAIPPETGADDFVIENSAAGGMTYLSPDSVTTSCYINTVSKKRVGGWNYSDSADTFNIYADQAIAATFDNSVVAGDTRFFIYDVDNGQLERVTVGAADSCGAGKKCLAIAN
jgi:hypothetical protein